VLNLAAGRVPDQNDRAFGGRFDQLRDAVGDDAKRVDRVADFRLVSRDVVIDQITGDPFIELLLGPPTMPVVAGNRDEQYRNALREELPESGTIERIDEELVPVRGATVDDRQRRRLESGTYRRQLQSRDVPVQAVHLVADDVPFD